MSTLQKNIDRPKLKFKVYTNRKLQLKLKHFPLFEELDESSMNRKKWQFIIILLFYVGFYFFALSLLFVCLFCFSLHCIEFLLFLFIWQAPSDFFIQQMKNQIFRWKFIWVVGNTAIAVTALWSMNWHSFFLLYKFKTME